MRDKVDVLSSCINLHWLRPDNALWVYSFYEIFAAEIQETIRLGKRTMDLGCGDGTTSFILLDGIFGPEFDVFHAVQADEANMTPNIQREESGSLYDKTGDFFNTYNNRWREYLNILKPAPYKYDFGIDWKQSLLQKASDLGIYKSLLCHDANFTLPFEDSTFDFIFSTSIYWLADTQKALHEISRLLASGGIFAFSCPKEKITKFTIKAILAHLDYPEIELLDRGRDANWRRHARGRQEWEKETINAGLRVVDYKQVHSSSQIMLGEVTIRTLLKAYKILYDRLLPNHIDIFLDFKKTWVQEISRLLLPYTDEAWASQKRHQMLYHAFIVQKR